MSFFKNLFGNNFKVNNPSEKQKLPKANILEYFKTDLVNVPDDTFYEAEKEINSAGNDVYNFRKNLDYLEFGIFEVLEVKIIDNRVKNIFFKTFKANMVKIKNLQILIDDIYMLYGSDENHKSKFSNNDLKDYNSGDFSVLFGRNWIDSLKYKYPITIDKFDDELTLSIYGIEYSGDLN